MPASPRHSASSIYSKAADVAPELEKSLLRAKKQLRPNQCSRVRAGMHESLYHCTRHADASEAWAVAAQEAAKATLDSGSQCKRVDKCLTSVTKLPGLQAKGEETEMNRLPHAFQIRFSC